MFLRSAVSEPPVSVAYYPSFGQSQIRSITRVIPDGDRWFRYRRAQEHVPCSAQLELCRDSTIPRFRPKFTSKSLFLTLLNSEVSVKQCWESTNIDIFANMFTYIHYSRRYIHYIHSFLGKLRHICFGARFPTHRPSPRHPLMPQEMSLASPEAETPLDWQHLENHSLVSNLFRHTGRNTFGEAVRCVRSSTPEISPVTVAWKLRLERCSVFIYFIDQTT